MISRTRAPASRTCRIASWWRSRSSITTITSRMSIALALGDQRERLGQRAVEVEQVGDLRAAGDLLHVHARAGVEHRARARTARSPRARSASPARSAACPRAGRRRCRPAAGVPSPICSPLKSIGASSFSPSPITTTPSIETESSTSRIASTAAWSAPSLSPRPTIRAAASAAASVTRTSSSARLRSGRVWRRRPLRAAHRTPGGLRRGAALLRAPDRADQDQQAADQRHEPARRSTLISPGGEPGLSITPRNSVSVSATSAVTAVSSPRGQDSAWPRTMIVGQDRRRDGGEQQQDTEIGEQRVPAGAGRVRGPVAAVRASAYALPSEYQAQEQRDPEQDPADRRRCSSPRSRP